MRTLLSVTLGGGDVLGIEETSVLLFLLGHALNSLSLVAADDKELLEAADLGSIVQLLRLVAFRIVSPQPCMFIGWPCTKAHCQQGRFLLVAEYTGAMSVFLVVLTTSSRLAMPCTKTDWPMSSLCSKGTSHLPTHRWEETLTTGNPHFSHHMHTECTWIEEYIDSSHL